MAVINLDCPLCQAQIDAANALHAALVGWQRADEVLASLARHFPSNTSESDVLPKAIVLNSLYATSVLAIQAMAKHVAEVLAEAGDQPGIEVVEKIAWLHNLGEHAKSRRFLSFASKYCHFFVDEDRFAILDDFAATAIRLHLGQHAHVYAHKPSDYHEYLAAVDRLRSVAGLACSYREMDRYLWLRGQWEQWRRPPSKAGVRGSGVNPEVRDLFSSECPAVKALLGGAFGGAELGYGDRKVMGG